MNLLTVFKTLGPIDLKSVRRDSLLAWIPAIPLIMALVLRLGVPDVTAVLQREWAFDLTPYYPLLLSSFVLLTPLMAGMVVGFLLLDERDEGILVALRMTPLAPAAYLLYRLGLPLLLGTIATVLGYPLIGLLPLPFFDLIAIAFLGAFTGPLMALFLATFADNKVAGFALFKLTNGLMMIPIVAFFIGLPWELLIGVLPSYWPLKVFWLAAAGRDYWPFFGVGVAVNTIMLWGMVRRFQRQVIS